MFQQKTTEQTEFNKFSPLQSSVIYLSNSPELTYGATYVICTYIRTGFVYIRRSASACLGGARPW